MSIRILFAMLVTLCLFGSSTLQAVCYEVVDCVVDTSKAPDWPITLPDPSDPGLKVVVRCHPDDPSMVSNKVSTSGDAPAAHGCGIRKYRSRGRDKTWIDAAFGIPQYCGTKAPQGGMNTCQSP